MGRRSLILKVPTKDLRGADFLRLVNALSALYPARSEEKRLLDAMLLATPREEGIYDMAKWKSPAQKSIREIVDRIVNQFNPES